MLYTENKGKEEKTNHKVLNYIFISLISLLAIIFAVLRLNPKLNKWNLQVDEIVLGLFIIAFLPWLIPFLRANIKRGKLFGVEVDFLEQRIESRASQTEIKIRESEEKIEEKINKTQEMINEIVIFSLPPYLYYHLFNLTKSQEYIYHKDPGFEKDLLTLRELNYIQYTGIRQLKDKENLVGKIKVTPRGKNLVELYESKKIKNESIST